MFLLTTIMDIEQIKSDAQKVIDDINAFVPVSTPALTIVSVTVNYSDGTSTTFQKS